jgi:prepilin-type N-terminal cleavage/methylation domain-containing protein
MGRSGRGYTLVEVLIAVVMMAIIAGLTIPSFLGFMQRSRLDAAVGQIVEHVREARSRATMTGWQYKVLGFNYGGGNALKNQYRLMARSSPAVAWPGDTVAPFQSATQMAGVWVNFNNTYPGVRVNPQDTSPRFWVAFDARGVAFDIDPSFQPLQVTYQTGGTKTVTVTTAGSVRIQ